MRIETGALITLLFGISVTAGCAAHGPKFGQLRAAGAAPSGEPPALDCNKRKDDRGVLVSDARARARRGFDDQRFSDRVSTTDAPIEVCGYAQQLSWLTAMHCDDGSRPWGDDVHAAHAARRGSVDPDDLQSSCMHPIDVYEAKCPEKTYVVYINLYVCPANEGIMDNWGPGAG
jgi:hypothetical protein